jgi:hypothetical protein
MKQLKFGFKGLKITEWNTHTTKLNFKMFHKQQFRTDKD